MSADRQHLLSLIGEQLPQSRASSDCPTCDGTGEGMRDGYSCTDCRGRGYALPRDADDARIEAWIDAREGD